MKVLFCGSHGDRQGHHTLGCNDRFLKDVLTRAASLKHAMVRGRATPRPEGGTGEPPPKRARSTKNSLPACRLEHGCLEPLWPDAQGAPNESGAKSGGFVLADLLDAPKAQRSAGLGGSRHCPVPIVSDHGWVAPVGVFWTSHPAVLTGAPRTTTRRALP